MRASRCCSTAAPARAPQGNAARLAAKAGPCEAYRGRRRARCLEARRAAGRRGSPPAARADAPGADRRGLGMVVLGVLLGALVAPWLLRAVGLRRRRAGLRRRHRHLRPGARAAADAVEPRGGTPPETARAAMVLRPAAAGASRRMPCCSAAAARPPACWSASRSAWSAAAARSWRCRCWSIWSACRCRISRSAPARSRSRRMRRRACEPCARRQCPLALRVGLRRRRRARRLRGAHARQDGGRAGAARGLRGDDGGGRRR
jgi:hypothetical protein